MVSEVPKNARASSGKTSFSFKGSEIGAVECET